MRRYWTTRASPFSVGVYMECNTVAGSVTWLFREVPGWPREAGVERGLCVESEGATMRLEEVRTGDIRDRARRDARGGAPSFVSCRRASLHLASSSLLFPFSPPTADSVSTPCEMSLVPTLAAAVLSFPFVRTVIFCGNPQMWLRSHPPHSSAQVYEGRPASLRKAGIIDTGAMRGIVAPRRANKEK